ncbi:NADAR family protein [Acinetobacter sp.]|uniref:NADAR family protein n=1 Tax=Acinetobacter sp. TaxID=472 RepID=UPI002487AC59|nr:NADAR family protein [Acinetobacter sp.]MDI1222345.1 NADAR family protein [Acinetobacter sp.]
MDRNPLGADIREYDRRISAVFRKTTEKWGGLSNMAAGFPVVVNGIHIRSSEALYQACRFPHLPSVQEQIILQTSPMTAKMVGKPYRDDTRKDWRRLRIIIMKWCLRVKLVQNWNEFEKLLLETGDLQIVESSNKDAFWGAKPIDENSLVGVNALGRLLMELRSFVIQANGKPIEYVSNPKIDDFLILGESIKRVNALDARTVTNPQLSVFDIQQSVTVGKPLNATFLSAKDFKADTPLDNSSHDDRL